MTINYTETIGFKTIHHALAKADHIHGASDGIRQGENKTYRATEFRSQ